MLTYITTVVLFVVPVIAGPWTNVTCIDNYWSYNSRGQNPCLVAAYLAAQCTTDNTFGVTTLQGDHYYEFHAGAETNCLCNSVVWNLVSACALCQNKPAGPWSDWSDTCPKQLISIGKYPLPLPAEVTVPSWAYYDFTSGGAFNPVTAQQKTGPESSAFSSTTSTLAPSATTGVNPGQSTSGPFESIPKSSSNTSAIVGGVIAGVLGICFIGLMALVLLWKRKYEEPATNYPEASHSMSMVPQPNPATSKADYVPPYHFGVPNQLVPTAGYNPYSQR
ncbi:hypothetical protein OPQ81_003975 [Rhizoctonia solani]|nr:hypothetical protein OPQ81_003975 [Rhizoctonia solani]